ncbi:MAG TPA: YceI family protein [Dokdonella sp.]|uniref:YceI family protein n=1 Tax=Dokdonella sp. TaxID=2291710 RepID=UPI002D80EA0B|nr:YceI family protein [Dokdonella sp.]HET9034275.1 YceI family protein [Dokdonella sp.]
MLKQTLLASALALVSGSVFAATEAYTIDGNHTQANFTWTHFGYSNPSGGFNDISGTINFDAEDPTRSSVDVSIAIDSLNTQVEKLDEHLKKADFFDAAKYPTATFKSTRIVKGATKNEFKVSGDLTIHGVTRPVTLDATLNRAEAHPMSKKPTIGFDGSVTIKRSDFGIGAYVPNVSDEIRIHITTEASVAKPKAE